MKYLVTGASGFIGSYLVEFLLQKGDSVCACDQRFEPRFSNLIGNLVVYKGDIQKSDYVKNVVLDYKPDIIIHLAAQSFPNVSWKDPAHTFQVNTIGTINILEAIHKAKLKPRIILVSSSGVYAFTSGPEPIKEDYPLDPSSPYGVSKLFQEQLAKLYIKRYEMDVILVRPFFLIGPKKVGDVCSDFARSIVAIERGFRSNIEVGNLEIVRDFLDVRDGIEALYLLANKGITGKTYNICSGKGYSLRFVLDFFKKQSKYTVDEKIDSSKIRPIDELVRIGDPRKIKRLGWHPLREIEATLAEILQFWRAEDY